MNMGHFYMREKSYIPGKTRYVVYTCRGIADGFFPGGACVGVYAKREDMLRDFPGIREVHIKIKEART